jgi:hypothetical protein
MLEVPSVCGAKDRLGGERLSVRTAELPVRLIYCGLPGALSAMLSVAVCVPAIEELYVT